jgi:hypothetical protein
LLRACAAASVSRHGGHGEHAAAGAAEHTPRVGRGAGVEDVNAVLGFGERERPADPALAG